MTVLQCILGHKRYRRSFRYKISDGRKDGRNHVSTDGERGISVLIKKEKKTFHQRLQLFKLLYRNLTSRDTSGTYFLFLSQDITGAKRAAIKVASLLAHHITKDQIKPQRKFRLETTSNNYLGVGGGGFTR